MAFRMRWWVVAGLAVLFLLGAGIAEAQQQQPGAAQREPPGIRVFEVPEPMLPNILQIVGSVYKVFPVGDSAISVVGTREQLDAAAIMIETLSKETEGTPAPSQVRLLISIVGANEQGESGALPEHLKEALAELRSMFPYRGYQLLDAVPIVVSTQRVSAGALSHGIDAILPECSPIDEAECQQSISWMSHGMQADGTVKLVNLQYRLRVPIKMVTRKGNENDSGHLVPDYQNSSISTSLDIAPGQTVVVGKVNPGSKQDAIFVVVSRLKN